MKDIGTGVPAHRPVFLSSLASCQQPPLQHPCYWPHFHKPSYSHWVLRPLDQREIIEILKMSIFTNFVWKLLPSRTLTALSSVTFIHNQCAKETSKIIFAEIRKSFSENVQPLKVLHLYLSPKCLHFPFHHNMQSLRATQNVRKETL